jgi:hypothetical protein
MMDLPALIPSRKPTASCSALGRGCDSPHLYTNRFEIVTATAIIRRPQSQEVMP